MLFGLAQNATRRFTLAADIDPNLQIKYNAYKFSNIAHDLALFRTRPATALVANHAKHQQHPQRILSTQKELRFQIGREFVLEHSHVGIFDFWPFGPQWRGDSSGDRWIKNGAIIIAGPINRIGETGLLSYRRRILRNNASN